MAGFWLFRLTQLGIGQRAGALDGTDPYHRPVHLSDLAGKVVVLTFTIGGDADRTVYDRCERLLGEFQGRPFVCLSVIPDNGMGPGSARSIVRTMGITWPVIREEPGGPLVSRWCQIPLGTPNSAEVFVIDQRGIIRHHEPDNPTLEVMSDALTQKVRALLQAQEP
jgi:hypothetical protein